MTARTKILNCSGSSFSEFANCGSDQLQDIETRLITRHGSSFELDAWKGRGSGMTIVSNPSRYFGLNRLRACRMKLFALTRAARCFTGSLPARARNASLHFWILDGERIESFNASICSRRVRRPSGLPPRIPSGRPAIEAAIIRRLPA